MNERRIQVLEKEPVTKAIIKMALPMMTGMIVQILYSVIDTFFVGQLNDPDQVAAVAISMPLFMLLMAISGTMGNGGASFLSRVLGAKEYEKANKTVSIAFFICVFIGAITSVLGMLLIDPIINLLGATPSIFSYARSYSLTILVSSIIIMCNYAMGQLLRAEGGAKEAMIGMLIGTITNIVFDPIFIFVFKMGATGAAVATVIANAFGLVYYFSIYLRKKSMVHISLKYFSFDRQIISEILKIGIPSSLNQLLLSVANIFTNNFAAIYGSITVAAMGIAGRINMIPIYMILGVAIGCQPLIGYSYGAQLYSRLKEIIRKAVIISSSMSLSFMVLFMVFSREFISFFIKDPEVVNTGSTILVALSLSLLVLGVQIVIMNAIQAMGKAIPSLIISVSRQGLMFIPLLFILNRLFAFNGFIYAQPVADICTVVLALSLFAVEMKKMKKKTVLNLETLEQET
jgi:putative MATE family efflux protein